MASMAYLDASLGETSASDPRREPGQQEEPSWRAEDYTWDPHQLGALKHESPLGAKNGADGLPQSLGAAASGGAARVQRQRQRLSEVTCQVCSVPLAAEKFYYRRYRICREHVSLEERLLKGRRVQWCQQCGQFQPKEEFMPGRKSCHRSLQRRRTAARVARREAASAQSASPKGTSQRSPRTDNTVSGSGTGSDPTTAPISSSSSGRVGQPANIPTLEEILDADPGMVSFLGLGLDGSSAEIGGAALAAASCPDSALASAAGPAYQQEAAAPAQLLHTYTSDGVLMPPYSTPRYATHNRLFRCSMKLFSAVPEMLPPNLLAELMAMMEASDCMLEGYIRPGCVDLTIDVLLPDGPATDRLLHTSALDLALRFLSRAPLACVTQHMQMHVRGDIAFVEGGEVASIITTKPEGKGGFLPQLLSVSPLAATCGKDCRLSVEVEASGLGGSSDSILCGLGGHYLPVAGVTARSEGTLSIDVDLSGADMSVGALRLEGRRGALLSSTMSVLVMPCAASAAEVCQLEETKGSIVEDIPSFLYEMGLVIRQSLSPGTPAPGTQGEPGGGPGHPTMIAAASTRLAALAVSMQWLHVTRLLLPLTLATDRPAAEVVADMDASLPKGTSVLGCAIVSGNVDLARELLLWGQQAGFVWPICDLRLGAPKIDMEMLEMLAGFQPEQAAAVFARPVQGVTAARMAAAERAARSDDIGRIATELPRRARGAAQRAFTPTVWKLFVEMAAFFILFIGIRKCIFQYNAT